MKNIDGYVTKDSLYRLLSDMRMSQEIVDDNTLSKVAQAVADMKPVDAQLVKHGRWIDNGIVYTCSECNSGVPKNIFVVGCDFEGCPYCFARMDDA